MMDHDGVRAHVEMRALMVPFFQREDPMPWKEALARARMRERKLEREVEYGTALPASGREAPRKAGHSGGPPRSIKPEQEGLLVELRARGLSYVNIGLALGCSKNAASSALARIEARGKT